MAITNSQDPLFTRKHFLTSMPYLSQVSGKLWLQLSHMCLTEQIWYYHGTNWVRGSKYVEILLDWTWFSISTAFQGSFAKSQRDRDQNRHGRAEEDYAAQGCPTCLWRWHWTSLHYRSWQPFQDLRFNTIKTVNVRCACISQTRMKLCFSIWKLFFLVITTY